MLACPLCAKSGLMHLQQKNILFDHLVDAGEQLRRHFEAERLGRMQVDGELELGRLQHRKLCRLGAIDDAAAKASPRIRTAPFS